MAMVVGAARVLCGAERLVGFGRLSVVEAEAVCAGQPCLGTVAAASAAASAACCSTAGSRRRGLKALKPSDLRSGGFDEFRRRGHKFGFRFPVCLLQGFGGAFWESGESESSTSSDQFSTWKGCFKQRDKLALLSVIQQIEPLDVSHISKDASAECMDAMKRTISGMLGLLPSDQFQVTIEALKEPLAKLLVSSMMTGYTLRNAEYRLCLQRSLDSCEEDNNEQHLMEEEMDRDVVGEGSTLLVKELFQAKCELSCNVIEDLNEDMNLEERKLPEKLGPLSPEAERYIRELQSRLMELESCKQAKTALEMEKIVGDEKNDLLDYLRSLAPDKVAELSRPILPEVEEVVQTIVDGLLETLCASQASKKEPSHSNATTLGSPWKNGLASPELLGSVPLQSESSVTASRDHLARLLFWCMLLGHYMRGMEYRLELSHTLTLTGGVEENPDASRPS
ncbi:hypothetical protein O6H91_14G050500 [Diphasiastrum complanatum]|uniref:Uncharacterized protein n=1 Tax=Diphasiastrum complanatum TaxID=34168 RepID=A0ACC2BPH1_DIPCM|nr:hypothetical protein O6H91_14G050500 [Diphasiastrum complanatum]